MPAAIPIVATVAAGAAAIGGYTTIALAITIAAQVSTQLLTKKPSLGAYRDTSERKQVLRAAASPKTVVYGRTISAGTLFFSEEEKGDQTDGEWLHLAITLASHPLSGVGTIYLGDDDIGSYPDNATYEVHNDRQTADPFMLQNCPSWKEDMIGKGISWLRVSLKFNAEKFPSGIPNIKAEKTGRKVYDPRTGRTEYSNNLALCVLDYYRNYLKVPDADINWDQFQEAANICDETVTNGDGTSEKRYTLNGEFDLSENKASILEAMLAAGAGEPTYIAGKHGILVGAYYGPATEVITESQLAGDIEIMPEVSQSERVNTINGTFIDPKQTYAEADFPAVSVSEWVAEDGVEISQDLKLRFVTSEFQAQRLADIKLKRTRISRTMNLTLNLSGYRYRPGMYVKVNFPSLGIINVEMRVTDWKFGVQNGVQITLKQETADIWGDAIGKPIERPPFTQLPSGGVAQPQNLKYTVEEIGQVVQGVLSWQNIGQFVYNRVVIRKSGHTVLSVQVPGSFTRLTGLVQDTYTAHVTAVNQMGAESPEAYLEFSIQAPPPPSRVDIEQSYFAITLYPRLAAVTNVSTQFDFWTSGETRLPNTSTPTVEGGATRAGVGTTWSSHGLKNGHTYYWYVRTINAFGTSAFVEVAALCQTDTSDLIDVIDEAVRNSDAMKNVEKGVDTNLEGILQNALANKGTVDRQFQQLGEVNAEILTVRTTIATVDQALAQLTTSVKSQFEGVNSQILQQQTAISNNTQAIASLDTYVQSQVGDLTAAVNQKMNAEVTSNGSAKASYTLNLGVIRNGVKYNTGLGMSIEPSGSSYKSTMVVAADQFGIYSGSDPGNYEAAFFVYNGQVFIRDAMIQDGSITNAKIGSYIRSTNFAAGVRGWNIDKNGDCEFHGKLYADSGNFAFNGTNNTVVINNNGITVNIPGGGRIVVGSW
ncbi:phage tail tip fiber protein [Enterobacter cancerogenus]|uniref:phage tail tip fiber protein n=1 Tax=Enterobacter cancerogenus TaxID=69218 RepID=UPI004058DD2E